MNPLSRFKPLDHLPLAPGVCFICLGGVGPYIDTSRQIDFEGAIYVCKGCIMEMATQLGLDFASADEITEKINTSFLLGKGVGAQETMELFGEFSRTYADRTGSDNATASIVPRPDNVAAPVGAEQNKPEQQQSSVEGDGFTSLEELGSLPGYSSDGERPIFDI